MSNRGVEPVDPDTEVGELRIALGDLSFNPLNPVEIGFADYEWFSDQELEQMLTSANDNMHRATAYGLMKFARYLAFSASNITTDDLRIETLGRAKLMRDLAKDELALADADDAAVNADIFDIVPFAGMRGRTLAFSRGGGEKPEEWILDDDGYYVSG